MKISLLLFVLGTLFITAGYAHQMKPSCERGIEVKYVPIDVFDELENSRPYSEGPVGVSKTKDGIFTSLDPWIESHQSGTNSPAP
tara:strand:+ start:419 stop:673 length:255 start_codon:yes stop_codon:yes gene_type:complete